MRKKKLGFNQNVNFSTIPVSSVLVSTLNWYLRSQINRFMKLNQSIKNIFLLNQIDREMSGKLAVVIYISSNHN